MLKSHGFSTRFLVALATLALWASFAGCGDDAQTPTDAAPTDARLDAPPDAPADALPPDAAPDAPQATVAGFLSVADVTLVDPAAAAVGGIRGGSINIGFRDLTTGGGTVVAGTSPLGGCL